MKKQGQLESGVNYIGRSKMNKDYFDGLSDHSITGYADNLLEYVEVNEDNT